MAAVDKISEWIVWFVVIFWITRKASTQYIWNTCYEWSNDARLTSSFCTNRYRTQCCYGTCCNNWQYRSRFLFKTCKGSGGYYPDEEKCRSYQSTDCCPVVLGGRTVSDWATCCAGRSTGTSTTKEVTYRRCYDPYTTGYCTNPSSTFCCYGTCCGVNDYYNSFGFSKCGYLTCRDYRSTHCCTKTWPWKATSCCRPTASTSLCCSSTPSTTTTRTTTTTNYKSSTSEPDPPSSGLSYNNTSMIVILGGGGGATVILIIVLAVVCAKCSAARRARRQTRTRRTQATSGPRVAGPTPTAAGNMPQPYPHAYMNPAMQTPGSAQGYNPYAEPPPAYNDAVFMTQLRPPDYSAYKDEMPPSYEAVAAENYPRVLAVASAPVVPPPYENNE